MKLVLLMFWKTKLNQYVPNSGKAYTQRPGQFQITFAASSDVARITFVDNMPFTYFYLRSITVGGATINIWGDDYGARATANTIDAIGVFSTGNLVGSPSIVYVRNVFALDATNNLHLFEMEPWRTRNLYMQASGALTATVNYSYIY